MNKIKILSLTTIMTTLISFSLASCAQTTPPPSTPEIPGTELITLDKPAHNTAIGAGGVFQYSAPDKVTFFVLVIGDTGGANPLKVTGQLVENVKFGCTSDLGMGRNSTNLSSVRGYNSANFTFSITPATGLYGTPQSWFVIGYDSNMNMVASSPKWDLSSITFP